MRVTLRALLVGWRAEIAAAAEYRADLIVGTIISTVWLGLAVVPAVVVFQYVDAAAGWTLERLLFLQAVWYLMDGVMWIVIQPNLWALSEQVRTGDLDFYLLQPGSALARMSLTLLNPADLPKILLSAALGTVAIVRGIDLSPAAAFLGAVGIVAAMVLMWAIGVLTHVKAITAVRFEAGFAMHAAHNLARIPVTFYGRALSAVLTFVVPIAFLSTVPAELVFGTRDWRGAMAAIGVAAAAVLLTNLAWRREIERYSGATA